jgi:hypothetical protein
LRRIDAGKNPRRFGDPRQPLVEHVGAEVFEVRHDVVLVGTDVPRPSRISMVIER